MSWLLPAAALLLIFAGRRKDESEAAEQDVETERRRIVEQAKSELTPLETTALRDVVDAPATPVITSRPRRKPARKPARKAPRKAPRARKAPAVDEDLLAAEQAARAALAAEKAGEKDDRVSVPSDPVKARPVPAKPAQPARAPVRVTRTPGPAPEVVVAIPDEPEPAVSLPEGYDPEAARRQAQSAANHIRKREYDYSRKLLRDWQVLAGLKPDGIYGPKTRSALRHFGATKVPSPLFRRRKDKTIIRDSDPDAQYIPPEAR